MSHRPGFVPLQGLRHLEIYKGSDSSTSQLNWKQQSNVHSRN